MPAAQYFTGTDYLLSLPILMLAVFAMGILLIDLITPAEWKWINPATAFMGVLFSTAGVLKIQYAQFEAAKVGRSLEVAGTTAFATIGTGGGADAFTGPPMPG